MTATLAGGLRSASRTGAARRRRHPAEEMQLRRVSPTTEPNRADPGRKAIRSALVVAAVILLAAGCARGGAPSSADADAAFHTRAQELADAWHTALAGPAGQTWKTGLVSLQDLTVPPAAG